MCSLLCYSCCDTPSLSPSVWMEKADGDRDREFTCGNVLNPVCGC